MLIDPKLEQFADVPGYEQYAISNHGRVIHKKSGRIWPGSLDKDGYRQLTCRS